MAAISVNTPEYINKLEFDYVETYSFQRGQEYEDNLINQQTNSDQLRDRKKNGDVLSEQEEVRYQELHGLLNNTQYLINSRNEFHSSDKKIATISAGDKRSIEIREILTTKVLYVPKFLCAPFHRDAILFYDKEGNIVSALNICFSCMHLETLELTLKGDAKTYYLLAKFLHEIGHEIPVHDMRNTEEYYRLMHRIS